VTLKVIILELVVTEVSMRGKQSHVNGGSSKMEDESLGETENIIIDSCDCRFSLFRKNIFQSKYFIDGSNDIAEDIVPGDCVRVGIITADDDKLVGNFIVPDDPINPVVNKFDVVVGLGVGIEEVDFAVLVLENQFGGGLVDEHSQDGVVWFVLHDDVLVFEMVKFQL
jgi:hypothetical protein